MQIQIETNKVDFSPIELTVRIKITSQSELHEILRYNGAPSEVYDNSGDSCDILTEILENISSEISDLMD